MKVTEQMMLSDMEDTIKSLSEELQDAGHEPLFIIYVEVEYGDDLICISKDCVVIPAYGLKLYDGIYCNRNEDTGEYDANFSLTYITDLEGTFLYFKNDGMRVSLMNFLYSQGNVFFDSSEMCYIEYYEPEDNC